MNSGYDKLPDHQSQEYLWWSAGAKAEAETRKEGLSQAGAEVSETADALAKLHPLLSRAELASRIALVFTAGNRKARWRLIRRLIWS